MKTYEIITVTALLIFIVALPFYALQEGARMERAEAALRQQILAEGSELYLTYCAQCHGASGEGSGVMPVLNHPALAEADHKALFRVIARAAHGTTMAAWHIDEGGILNDYQIEELVAVIRFADWSQVGELAATSDFQAPLPPVADAGITYMEYEGGQDPHQCAACHEEPAMHAGRFGLNCARCHSSIAWAPAMLTKHNFFLDHGGEGNVECAVCHTENYFEHSCYACHDHQPDEMQQVHKAENILEYQDCIACHPTGVEGEAEQMMNEKKNLAGAEAVSQLDRVAGMRGR